MTTITRAEVAAQPTCTREECAVLLNCCVETVSKLFHKGDLPGKRVGRGFLFKPAEVLQWIDRPCPSTSAKIAKSGGSTCGTGLRHTWASWHAMAGTPMDVLQKLGGWETREMVERYAQLSPGYVAQYAGNAKPLATEKRRKRG